MRGQNNPDQQHHKVSQQLEEGGGERKLFTSRKMSERSNSSIQGAAKGSTSRLITTRGENTNGNQKDLVALIDKQPGAAHQKYQHIKADGENAVMKLVTPSRVQNTNTNGNGMSSEKREKGRSSLKKKQVREEKKEKLRKLLFDKLGIEDIKEIKLKCPRGSQDYEHHVANTHAQANSPRRRAGVSQPLQPGKQNFKIMMFDTHGDHLPQEMAEDKLRLTPYQVNITPERRRRTNQDEQRDIDDANFIELFYDIDDENSPERQGSPRREKEITNFNSLYKLKGLLGVGAFGVVLLVINRQTFEESALKIINKTRLSNEAREFLRNESHIMKVLNGQKSNSASDNLSTDDSSPTTQDPNFGHRGIVKFKQIFDTPIYAVIEMEYIQGGLLKKLFKLPSSLSETQASEVVKNILEGLSHIHDFGFIHRDLKPENIMLANSSQLDVKIVDFGLSVKHKGVPINQQEQVDDKVGTLVYMAPEQASYKSYSKRIDLWSVGIIMYQLMSQGKHPLYDKEKDSYYDYLQKLRQIAREENKGAEHLQWRFPQNFSELAKDFFSKLCSYPASERYDCKMALEHPWITRKGGQEDIPLTRKQKLTIFNRGMDLKRAIKSVLFCAVIGQTALNLKGQRRSNPIDRDYINRVIQVSANSDSTQASYNESEKGEGQQNEDQAQDKLQEQVSKSVINQLRKREQTNIKKKKELAVKQNLQKQEDKTPISNEISQETPIVIPRRQILKSPSPRKQQTQRKLKGLSTEHKGKTKMLEMFQLQVVQDVSGASVMSDYEKAKLRLQNELSVSAQFALNNPVERILKAPISKLGQYHQEPEQPSLPGHSSFHLPTSHNIDKLAQAQNQIRQMTSTLAKRRTETPITEFALNFPMPNVIRPQEAQPLPQNRYHQMMPYSINITHTPLPHQNPSKGPSNVSVSSILCQDQRKKSTTALNSAAASSIASKTLCPRKLSQIMKNQERGAAALPSAQNAVPLTGDEFSPFSPQTYQDGSELFSDFGGRIALNKDMQAKRKPSFIRDQEQRSLHRDERNIEDYDQFPMVIESANNIDMKKRKSRGIHGKMASSSRHFAGGAKESSHKLPLVDDTPLITIPKCLYNSGSKVLQNIVQQQQKITKQSQQNVTAEFAPLSLGETQRSKADLKQQPSHLNPRSLTRKSVIAQAQLLSGSNYNNYNVGNTLFGGKQSFKGSIDPYVYLQQNLGGEVGYQQQQLNKSSQQNLQRPQNSKRK
ncbi:hypothetical protein FGO68_gene3298 [Halteria grandinella]|uniref:Protein kinase domain-containing protein n=1 Tax=Halteria grandinella TaxID=5974 RepID=A0A8J8P2G9_HALGN|nr:hypothetical protein FGO68_gene3298 [Halteria grandinella]